MCVCSDWLFEVHTGHRILLPACAINTLRIEWCASIAGISRGKGSNTVHLKKYAHDSLLAVLCCGWVQMILLTFLSQWWCNQMETFSALLAYGDGNLPVIGRFPSRRTVARSFDVFFDLRLNTWLRKQSRRRWFETPWCSLRRHCKVLSVSCIGATAQPLSDNVFLRCNYSPMP